MKSNFRTASDDQQLPIRLVRGPQEVDPTLVVAQPTFLAAIKLCISLGGFESEKQVYVALGIDASHWTRILRGDAHFPVDKLPELMDLCGNEAPLIWLTYARGYDVASLRKRESETERKLRDMQERAEAAELRARILTEALQGRAS